MPIPNPNPNIVDGVKCDNLTWSSNKISGEITSVKAEIPSSEDIQSMIDSSIANYSTDEKVIGKYNNKDLYELTIIASISEAAYNQNSLLIDLSALSTPINIDQIIYIDGVCHIDGNPGVTVDDTLFPISAYDNGKIYVKQMFNGAPSGVNFDFIVKIRYTKRTT